MSPSFEVVHGKHSDIQVFTARSKHIFPKDANTASFARSLDESDPLKCLRDQFIIPSKSDLKTTSLTSQSEVAMMQVKC